MALVLSICAGVCEAQIRRVAIYSDSLFAAHGALVKSAVDERPEYEVVAFEVQPGRMLSGHTITERLADRGAASLPRHDITVASFGTNEAISVARGEIPAAGLSKPVQDFIRAAVHSGSRCVVWLQGVETVVSNTESELLDRYTAAAAEFYRFIDALAARPPPVEGAEYQIRIADWGSAVGSDSRYLADFIHPSREGAKLMADVLLRQLDRCTIVDAVQQADAATP